MLDDAGDATGGVDLTALSPGDHLCGLYDDDHQRARVAAGFVRAGVAAGDRVLYVTIDPDPRSVRRNLAGAGVAVDRAVSTGQLVLTSFEEIYASGPASFDDLARGFREGAGQARADGFAGLRVAAEMGDMTRAFGSLDAVLEWEAQASELQAEEGITSVCQYDRSLLDDSEAARVVDVHDGVASDQPVEPLADLLASADPWGLQVTGEVDISNTEQLSRALRARLAARPEVRLDLSGINFMDVRSIETLFAAGRDLPGGLRLVGVPAQVRRVIDIFGFEAPNVSIAS